MPTEHTYNVEEFRLDNGKMEVLCRARDGFIAHVIYTPDEAGNNERLRSYAIHAVLETVIRHDFGDEARDAFRRESAGMLR